MAELSKKLQNAYMFSSSNSVFIYFSKEIIRNVHKDFRTVALIFIVLIIYKNMEIF